MAEFTEVVKQAKRLCAAQDRESDGNCRKCPLFRDEDGRYVYLCDGIDPAEDQPKIPAEEFERIVMKWAEENSEPKYPSWHEAWKQLFPNGQGSPCPAAYDTKYEPEGCGRQDCSGCKDRPISADVAERLGVKPVGGGAK